MTDRRVEETMALVLGGDVRPIGLTSNWQTFVFTPTQMQFIKNLEKLKNIHAAGLSVGWREETATGFLKSRKFQRYIGCRLQAVTARASMGSEAWWQYCRDVANGYRELVKAKCTVCDWSEEITPYEAETARRDDMTLDLHCRDCQMPATVERETVPFKPTREAVVAWQEWGARVEPKIERVHHNFENTQIIFESADSKEEP